MRPLEIVLTSVLGVIVIAIIIYIIYIVYYKKFKYTKIHDFKILNKYAPNNPIVFLGDSLTDFFPLNEYFHNGIICNRGIAGDTSIDILNRLDDVTCLNPSILFLQIGINDVIYNKNLNFKDLIDKIDKIINSFDSHTKKYIISLYPINKKDFTSSKVVCRNANNNKVIEINKLLKNYCNDKGIEFIDIYPFLVNDKGNLKPEYSVEGLHINSLVYTIIYNQLISYIKAYNENKE